MRPALEFMPELQDGGPTALVTGANVGLDLHGYHHLSLALIRTGASAAWVHCDIEAVSPLNWPARTQRSRRLAQGRGLHRGGPTLATSANVGLDLHAYHHLSVALIRTSASAAWVHCKISVDSRAEDHLTGHLPGHELSGLSAGLEAGANVGLDLHLLVTPSRHSTCASVSGWFDSSAD